MAMGQQRIAHVVVVFIIASFAYGEDIFGSAVDLEYLGPPDACKSRFFDAPLYGLYVDGDGKPIDDATERTTTFCQKQGMLRREDLPDVTYPECRRAAEDPRFVGLQYTVLYSRRVCFLFLDRPQYSGVFARTVPGFPGQSVCEVKKFTNYQVLLAPDSATLSGFCRTKGDDGLPQPGNYTRVSAESMVSCQRLAMAEGEAVVAFEYNEENEQCELHYELPSQVEYELGAWCFTRNSSRPIVSTPMGNLPAGNPVCLSKGPAYDLTGDQNPLLLTPEDCLGFDSQCLAISNPIATCTSFERNEIRQCMEYDADIFRYNCVCAELFDTSALGPAPSLQERLEAAFDIDAYSQCFVVYSNLVESVFQKSIYAYMATSTNWYGLTFLSETPFGIVKDWCEEFFSSYIGDPNAIPWGRCALVLQHRYWLRYLEQTMTCYVKALNCPASPQGGGNTCHADSGHLVGFPFLFNWWTWFPRLNG
mmetsp:Transcript_33081/g.81156  ORF Transcript_33081/g.81156 Transcript_33081/m.81156 type:complete len:477 (+) Transcript_33081:1-1431(+)